MASLRDLQLGFASALRSGHAVAVAHLVRPNGLAPARRVGIYANNVRETFLGTLEAMFPVLARLAGRDWLRQAGSRYLRAAPSRHGNLHFVGERFAAWLQAEVGDGPYAYFVDVARLEWTYQEVLVAAEPASALDLAALASVPPERHERLVLEPNPTLRLVESPWPLFAIWQANRAEVVEPPRVDLDSGPSRILIVRRDDHVELRELPAADYALLGALLRRQPLTRALEQALDADPAGDLAACLARCLQLGAACGFGFADSVPPTHRVPTGLRSQS